MKLSDWKTPAEFELAIGYLQVEILNWIHENRHSEAAKLIMKAAFIAKHQSRYGIDFYLDRIGLASEALWDAMGIEIRWPELGDECNEAWDCALHFVAGHREVQS